MALSDVIKAISDDMLARSVLLSEPIALGNLEPNKHGVFPRITVRATNDLFASAKQVGGVQPSHKTRRCGAEVHCWGETVASTETLMNEFVTSLDRTTKSYELASGGWNNDTGNITAGFEYILEILVEVPVGVESAYQTVLLTDIIADTILVVKETETVACHQDITEP